MSDHPTRKRQAQINLRTALEGITTVGGAYQTEVATVREYVAEWETAPPDGQLPWVGIHYGRVRVEPQGSGVFDCFLPVSVVCHIAAPTKEEAADVLEDLVDDVLVAVLADPYRGQQSGSSPTVNNAVTTKYMGEEHTASDPDTTDSRGITETMLVHFEIKYQRGITAQARND